LPVTPLMPVPLLAVKKPAIEPAPTALPRRAVPEPFWVTSSAVPELALVSEVLEVPAVLAVLPMMSGSPATASTGLSFAAAAAVQAPRPPSMPASRARRERGCVVGFGVVMGNLLG
jgi:hypothetical protein